MKILCVGSGVWRGTSTNLFMRGIIFIFPRSLLLAATLLTALIGLAATTALVADERLPSVAACSDSTATLPVGLRDGSVVEKATDLTVPGPRFPWTQERSYNSSQVSGNSAMGGGWFSTNGDCRLTPGANNAVVFVDGANSKQVFSFRDDKYSASKDGKLTLEKYVSPSDNGHYFRVTDTVSSKVDIFYDLGGSNAGLLREKTTRDWLAQGKAGTRYSYDSGRLATISTAQGQDYFIAFTYTGREKDAKLSKVEVRTHAKGALLKDVAYTYFTPGRHSPDVGTDGDLVQVRTRELKSNGNPESAADWKVHYTQYRYYRDGDLNGAPHLLKALFEPDAVQRILDAGKDVKDADAILAKHDTDSIGGQQVQEFASRRFAYYTRNPDPSLAASTVWGAEELQSKYGGKQVAVVDTSSHKYMLKSASAGGGCATCGSTVRGGRHDYYYLDVSHGASRAVNDVVRLDIDDTVDANGVGALRTIFGVSRSGQKLRQVLITDPAGTPQLWCQSWKFSSDATQRGRVTEYRTPAAHRVTSSTIKRFLDPTAGTK